jgi:hypothetical protein
MNSQIRIDFGITNVQKHNDQKETNRISTTKYNIITWLPLSLIMQFTRIANIYFLIISILTCLHFSPKNPITMIGTFGLVLVFTMLKEGYEVK